MADKQLGNNDYYQVDADKDLLSDFLNADANNDQEMNMKGVDVFQYSSTFAENKQQSIYEMLHTNDLVNLEL